MKIIYETVELNREFRRLMNSYQQYLWTVAWADFNFSLSKLLVSRKTRIVKICIGLQFFGTDVDFIREFYTHANVRFFEQSKGTFHPKLYLFRNSDKDWELLIGSPNYTSSAFEKNTETVILISSADKVKSNVYSNTIDFIDIQWKRGKILTKQYVENYAKRKSRIKVSMPKLPSRGIRQPIFEKTWKEYMTELKAENYRSRIKFLDWVDEQFQKYKHFDKMDSKTRKSIAGFGEGENNVEIGCFGTTGARYSFMNKVNNDRKIISDALIEIPKSGEVTKSNYQDFIRKFKKVSPHEELASATRLLCLWRPDYFINFNGKNENKMCNELRIKKSNVNYQTYWDLIVQPFINSEWSKQKIVNKSELKIYNYRVALLDCIYYKWET